MHIFSPQNFIRLQLTLRMNSLNKLTESYRNFWTSTVRFKKDLNLQLRKQVVIDGCPLTQLRPSVNVADLSVSGRKLVMKTFVGNIVKLVVLLMMLYSNRGSRFIRIKFTRLKIIRVNDGRPYVIYCIKPVTITFSQPTIVRYCQLNL